MRPKLSTLPVMTAPVVTFVSLNTLQVARAIAPLPDHESHKKILRLIRAGAGDISGLRGFHLRLCEAQDSVQFTVSRGRTELLTALLTAGGCDCQFARLRSWLWHQRPPARCQRWHSALITSLNPQTAPWLATLYRREIQDIALHEVVALVVFQRSLIAVLLSRSPACPKGKMI
jgi:hypothetical protein